MSRLEGPRRMHAPLKRLEEKAMAMSRDTNWIHQVPVKLYRTPDRLTVAAPMPGLLPEDFLVEVNDDGRLTLHGEPREGREPSDASGSAGEPREMLMDEWRAGGYLRELELPVPVDAELATATYGNGVLVVALPIAERTRPSRLTLERIGPGLGERVGSAGHPVTPVSTEEHWAAKAAVWSSHGGGLRG